MLFEEFIEFIQQEELTEKFSKKNKTDWNYGRYIIKKTKLKW